MTDASNAAGRSRLEIGVLITLATLGFAAVVGFIAVISADHVATAFSTGLGIAFIVFLAGGTVACALGCLRRGKAELVALGSILAAGLAIDLTVLAIWLEIDSEAFGKIAAVAFVWAFFALVILGLTLAVGTPRSLARPLYLGAVVTTVVAGLISTWLIATAGSSDVETEVQVTDAGTVETVPGETGEFETEEIGYYSYFDIGDDSMLRVLGALLVLIAALWFGALAASRLERPPTDVRR